VFVAAGDVTGDGRADIVTGAGPGGAPHVKVFDGATGAELGGFFAYDPAFTGGVFVAAGDVTGDGRADVVTAAGAGGGPHVRAFDGTTGAEVASFFAYEATFAGGLFVAAEVRTGPTVGSTPTTTVVTSSVNPAVFGQPVSFTATVTTASGAPTGVVTFRDGPALLGVSTLSASGQATLTAVDLTTGPHAITAEYGGNPTFAPSSGGLAQTVDKAATSLALESSLNPSELGQPVTFTATVSATPPGSGTPTGTVIFTVNGTPQSPVALAGAQATLTTALSPTGDHTITADYSGDADFEASTSPALVQAVTQAATATALASSLNPSGVGQAVTFTATVTAASGTPTGTVQFFDDATPLGTVPLGPGGQAQLTTSSLTAGSHPITAAYSGDGNFLGSTSPALTQQVVQVAVDDGFSATGNIAIVAAAPGVLTNDLAGSSVTQVQGSPAGVGNQVATSGGGTVTLHASGSLTYDPPAGVTGTTDTFTYQATTGGGAASTATVTITLTDILWFVCDLCGGSSVGTLLNPYTSVGTFSTNNTGAPGKPQDGHKIYIRSGSYDGSTDTLTLRNGQQVWGQGVAASDVITPASGPDTHQDFGLLMAAARPVISPASGTGNGIDVAVSNSVRHLDVGDVAPSATKLFGNGFGTLTIESVNLLGAGGAMNLTNGTLAASFDSVTSAGSTSTGISLSGVAGSLAVTPGSTQVTNSGFTGVILINNTATVSFGDVLIAPASLGRGLHATNQGGMLTVASGTIATTGATAVEIVTPAGVTPLNVTLTSVSASGAANGIVLSNTSGSFTVLGAGSPGSGGTIQNTTGADGSIAGNGIYLADVTNVSLSSMTVANHANHAIRGLDVTGFTLANSTISGVNGTNPGLDEGSVRFDGLFGTASITNTLIEGGVKDNVRILNTSGALNPLTVTGGTIGLNDATNGNDGILVLAEQTATVVVTVTGVQLLGARSDLFQANALGTATLNVTLQDNTFQNAHPNSVGGGVTIGGGDATSTITLTYNVSGTTPGAQTFQGARGSAITVNLVNGTGTAIGTIQNNTIGQAGVEGSGSTDGSGISVGTASTVTHTVTIDNNTIRGIGTTTPADSGFAGIDAVAIGDSQLNVTMTNNAIDELAGVAFAGIYLLNGGDVADTARMCADIQGNTVDASGAAGAFDLFGDQIAGTYGFPGFAGTTGGAALDTFLAGQNTFNGSGADTSAISSVDTAAVCP
jgi:hypothetical protein